MNKLTSDPVNRQLILSEVYAERDIQDEKFGLQDVPMGTGPAFQAESDMARRACDAAFAVGRGTYRDILTEEFWEAMAEDDPALLRKELIQVAAVAVKMIEVLDQNHPRGNA